MSMATPAGPLATGAVPEPEPMSERAAACPAPSGGIAWRRPTSRTTRSARRSTSGATGERPMFTSIPARHHTGPTPSLRLVALPALTAALFGNATLYLAGNALGAFATTVAVPPAGGPITLAAVLTFTVLGVAAGIAVAAIVVRVARRPA